MTHLATLPLSMPVTHIPPTDDIRMKAVLSDTRIVLQPRPLQHSQSTKKIRFGRIPWRKPSPCKANERHIVAG